jgi:flagellar P-ring protein precursor FlgI
MTKNKEGIIKNRNLIWHILCIALCVMKVFAFLMTLLLLAPLPGKAQNTRIKDIVDVEGVRENMLVGYGLVVGLNGTGDRLQNNAFTQQSLIAFLERQGVNTRGQLLNTRNVAAVTVTATLPPFSRSGSRIDVSLSSMGDARSLLGGTLLATPLYGADGQVYAVGQGAITINGFQAGGQTGTNITKGVPTNGVISGGGVVEREVNFSFNSLDTIQLALRNPDFKTAHNISRAINSRLGPEASVVTDPGTIQINIPEEYDNAVSYLIADIEEIGVETDQTAKVVIDEATGTIVMGENVRIDTVAVAQGNLVVRIEETPQVSQPNPFAPFGAETVVVPRTEVAVDEESDAKMAVLDRGASLKQLVGGLNALGVGPRDMIAILQNIKAAGALQAEIETR